MGVTFLEGVVASSTGEGAGVRFPAGHDVAYPLLLYETWRAIELFPKRLVLIPLYAHLTADVYAVRLTV